MAVVHLAVLFVALLLQALATPAGAGERTPLVIGMRDGGRIAVGGAHSCVIGSDGNVRCWGENGLGQLGNGTTTDSRTAVLVSNLTQVAAIAAGANHTCAVRAAGTVHCWGSSSNDQIGPGTGNRTTPGQVTGLVDIVAITTGARHTCALDVRGVVRCWGDNTQGQLGRAGTGTAAVDLDDVVAIGAGAEHTCAVDVRGDAFCWGRNTDNQLGAGEDVGSFEPLPVPVRFQGTALPGGGRSGFVAVSGGRAHTCGLREHGRAMCWGDNTFGQVGGGGNPEEDHPHDVQNVVDAISVSAGADFGCAIRVSGTARCWGHGTDGQLGNGSASDRLSSVAVQTLDNAVAVSAGGRHACALRADGTVHCWGDNSSGQLGNNSLTRRTSPVAAIGIAGDIGARAIASHSAYACALRGNGTVACWGSNGNGQLGDGTTNRSALPVPVIGVANATQIAVGNGHSCARIADGTLRCWGRNDHGQVGDGTTTTPRLAAATVPGLDGVVAVATGNSHTCVMTDGGSVRCWGDNQFGQIGDLTTTDSVVPHAPLLATPTPTVLTGVVAISASQSSSCARLFDNVMCWGRNDKGQLGINSSTVTVQTSPRAMQVAEASAVATGNHSCVVRVGGAVSCTGENGAGQVGDGTATNRIAPRQTTGFGDAQSVSMGLFHSCGLRGNGQALCWGDNTRGQLGDGTIINRAVPSPALGLSHLTALATGVFQTCAIDAAGQVFCVGQGSNGALGNGSFADRLTPLAVPSFAMNVAPLAVLATNGQVQATVLSLCDDAAHVRIRVTLTQGDASGTGHAVEACTGARESDVVRIQAPGRPPGFQAGGARADLEAVVTRQGQVIDVQQWSRTITLVPAAGAAGGTND
jgi:alpha-tubulin suppressor-like RCC1 family protein